MWKKLDLKNLFFVAVVINVVTILAVIILKNFLPPLVPLFYGRPAGKAQLTNTFGLLIAPAAAFLLTMLNLSISFWVKDEFLKKILAISALVISVLTVITIVKIISLVGFF